VSTGEKPLKKKQQDGNEQKGCAKRIIKKAYLPVPAVNSRERMKRRRKKKKGRALVPSEGGKKGPARVGTKVLSYMEQGGGGHESGSKFINYGGNGPSSHRKKKRNLVIPVKP